MDAQTDPKRELAFLREQMHASDQKIARLQNALDNCEDRLESSSLTAMLHAANLERDRTAVSGVNLDEEAAKLIQYQQAYQASAKMIQIAQNIFDSLIQGLGR